MQSKVDRQRIGADLRIQRERGRGNFALGPPLAASRAGIPRLARSRKRRTRMLLDVF